MQFFEELPAGNSVRNAQVHWAHVKREMLENPGLWGLIAEDVSVSTIGQLRAGKYKNFPAQEVKNFEFRGLRKKDTEGAKSDRRRTDLWGRYQGEGQAADA